MLGCLLPACLIWITFTAAITLAATCDDGWFGTGCEFMCHCANTLECDIDGTCINNSACAVPYFGHACQYVNLLSWDSVVPASQEYLRDNDDATCNPDPQATSVSVSLSTAYRLKWFRIHSKDKSRLMNFDINLDNSNVLCQNKRRYNVSDTIVEVRCEINVNVSKVEIVGDVAPHVCSLYVSIGRNVALKQYTNQSSTSGGNLSLSSNVVDGNLNPNYSSGSCSRTENSKPYAEWFLFFQYEYVLYLIRVFNRINYSFRLNNFKIFTKDINNRNLTTYTAPNATHQLYNIVMSDQRPVSSLSVWQADVPQEPGEHILTMCELETYGDSVCPENTFGLDCAKTCNCTKSQVCSPVSGACSEFCNIGSYGNNCTQSCAAVCSDTVGCATNTGECLDCKRPFKAPNCAMECLDGMYGNDCDMSCPADCLDSKCEKTTGHCLGCSGIRFGSQCEKCKEGLYGADCSMSCSTNCAGTNCSRASGHCLSCKGTRRGDLCDECVPAYVGDLCDPKCPEHCVNNTCDTDNGKCTKCMPGFSGEACIADSDAESSSHIQLVIVAVIVLIIITSALFLCLTRRRKRRHSVPEQRPGI